MNDPYLILLSTAATLGIVHTAIGVDHVVPFVVLAHARKWNLARTLSMTALCGMGHVFSSVLIASVGLAFGIATSQLEWIEATRGRWAAALLIGFGLAYAAIAFWKSRKKSVNVAQDAGHTDHAALNLAESGLVHGRFMPALFVLFVLGPCEALLPLLTASGLTLSLSQSVLVGTLFCAATLLTMLGLVTLGYVGLTAVGLGKHHVMLHRHAHIFAGISMAISGLAIVVLGV